MTLVANGRKEIIEFFRERFGLTSWDAVRYWRKNYKLPIRYYPSGRPYLIISEAERFIQAYSEMQRKKRGGA